MSDIYHIPQCPLCRVHHPADYPCSLESLTITPSTQLSTTLHQAAGGLLEVDEAWLALEDISPRDTNFHFTATKVPVENQTQVKSDVEQAELDEQAAWDAQFWTIDNGQEGPAEDSGEWFEVEEPVLPGLASLNLTVAEERLIAGKLPSSSPRAKRTAGVMNTKTKKPVNSQSGRSRKVIDKNNGRDLWRKRPGRNKSVTI